jgi:hypothetical protein
LLWLAAFMDFSEVFSEVPVVVDPAFLASMTPSSDVSRR